MKSNLNTKLSKFIQPLLKPFLAICLVFTLVLSQADGALAARSGGRAGGGSFRRAPTYSAPRSAPGGYGGGYSGGYGGGYYPGGGGFGFPFLLPLFGFGGGAGGLFTILIFLAIANFLVRSFRSAQVGGTTDSYGYPTASPTVSVVKVQVGLLSEARSLQADLNRIANSADTSSTAGLTLLLQETTLSLLRHPEYWRYAGSETQQTRLESAEDMFNRYSLAERSKFTEETLSNVNNQLWQSSAKAMLPGADGQLVQVDQDPGAYIVVTLVVATQGNLKLPMIRSSQDLRLALGQLGAVSSDNLLAVEVMWTPQAEGDTLSSDDMVLGYADLKLI
jgi:uncharacterized membrane protein